jgi:hypothetical protein
VAGGGGKIGEWSYVDLVLHAHLLELGGLREKRGRTQPQRQQERRENFERFQGIGAVSEWSWWNGKSTSKRKGRFVLQSCEITDEQNQFISHKAC